MPLRNFGLTSSYLGARPHVYMMWSPAHGVGVTLLIVILIDASTLRSINGRKRLIVSFRRGHAYAAERSCLCFWVGFSVRADGPFGQAPRRNCLVLGKTDANGKARALTLATGIDDPSCAVNWR